MGEPLDINRGKVILRDRIIFLFVIGLILFFTYLELSRKNEIRKDSSCTKGKITEFIAGAEQSSDYKIKYEVANICYEFEYPTEGYKRNVGDAVIIRYSNLNPSESYPEYECSMQIIYGDNKECECD